MPRAMPSIRVKLLSRFPADVWLHQFPEGKPVWGCCQFLLDRETEDYDWLVVYDDVPPRSNQGENAYEDLACPPSHTLLVTTEPPTVKVYGRAFTEQFGVVLTSQPEWALPHPQRIYAQPALHWFYGLGSTKIRSFREIETLNPGCKSRDLSLVFSPKRMRHTLHKRRHEFMRRLMALMPEMDVFGRGAHPLDDKAEALDPYRYHIAVENYIGPHHWTEKLADAFLGLALPFYCGCPNASDYFPADSFIPIDIEDPEGTARLIRHAIANDEYTRRLPAIIEARRRVLYEYNLFAVMASQIEPRHAISQRLRSDSTIYSRHALRRNSLIVAWQDLCDKVRVRWRSWRMHA